MLGDEQRMTSLDAGGPHEEARSPSAPSASSVPGESRLLRIAVGAIVNFVGLALLYGVNETLSFIALAVICTAGVGLILILFLCWLVGWVVLAAWRAIERQRPTSAAT